MKGNFLAGIPGVMLIFGFLLTGCPTDNSGNSPRIRSVTIKGSPTEPLEQREVYKEFSAEVDGDSDNKVLWSITGKKSPYTNIDHTTGVLTIGPDEPEGKDKITVTATSVVDDTQIDEASVSIVKADSGSGKITSDTDIFRRGSIATFTTTIQVSENQYVVWKVSGSKSGGTKFVKYKDGSNTETEPLNKTEHIREPENSIMLLIGDNEPVGTELLVTATSQQDPSITASYLLKVLDKPEVSNVTITPNPALWIKGESAEIRFTAKVDGETGVNPQVTWKIQSGTITNGTAIDKSGVLTIAAEQDAAITITATSSANRNTKTATVTAKPIVPITSLTPLALSEVYYTDAEHKTTFKNLAVGEERELPRGLSKPNGTVTIVKDITINMQDIGSDTVTWSVDGSAASKVTVTTAEDGAQTVTGIAPGRVSLTATITDGKAPGTPYTQEFQLDITQVKPGLTISYEPNDTNTDVPTVGSQPPIILTTAAPDRTVNVAEPTNYSHYIWIIDGVTVWEGSGGNYAAYTLSKSEFSIGVHYLTVIAYKDETPYSQEVSFSVSN